MLVLGNMLSVVIPCKNEAESIFAVLTEMKEILQSADIVFEIIVVDNNSTDSTAKEALRAGEKIRVVPCIEPGYGAAIMEGIKAAKYNLITMLDGDGSYNPKDIVNLYSLIQNPDDTILYIGNRFTGTDTSHIRFLNRIVGVPFLNFVTNTLYGAKESYDSHCGLRIFSKKTYASLNMSHTDFSFANEMVCKALRNKIQIIQKPIILRKDLRIKNISKIKRVHDGLCALKTIISLKF